MSTIEQLRKYFEGRRLIIPIVLGLGVALFMLSRDFDYDALRHIKWGKAAVFYLILAIVMMVFRDLGYIIRLRILSEKFLSWRQSFQLTMLWEFASALSPGIVGGTAAAFVLLAQEKIGTGRSTAIVLATSFLDVLFYLITVPIIILFTGFSEHIPQINLSSGIIPASYLKAYIITSFIILFIWAAVVFVGLFIRPQWISGSIRILFSLPVLKRWKEPAREWGEEVIVASKELSAKGSRFWIPAFIATFFSWIARFAVINFIIMALGPTEGHVEIMIRQLLMWCILILPITPGASGLAEALFPAFLRKYFVNDTIANIGTLIWRLLSYYPYLIIGTVIFPVWIRRIIKKPE